MIRLAKKLFTYSLLFAGFMLTSSLWAYVILVILKKLRVVV